MTKEDVKKYIHTLCQESRRPFSALALSTWENIAQNIYTILFRGNFNEIGTLLAEIVEISEGLYFVPFSPLWMANSNDDLDQIIKIFREAICNTHDNEIEKAFIEKINKASVKEKDFEYYLQICEKLDERFHNVHLYLYRAYAEFLYRQSTEWFYNEFMEMLIDSAFEADNANCYTFLVNIKQIIDYCYMTQKDVQTIKELKLEDKTVDECLQVLREHHYNCKFIEPIIYIQNVNCYIVISQYGDQLNDVKLNMPSLWYL